MFHRRTVFVVGAGASCELGFPSGPALLDQIIDMLQLNREPSGVGARERIVQALSNLSGGTETDEFLRFVIAATRLVTAATVGRSIDNILEQHEDDERVILVGKMAIVNAILEAEASSRLSPGGNGFTLSHVGKLKNTWHYKFCQMLTEGIPRQNANRIFENVSIICFNYDRAIEYYLPFHIALAWGMDLGSARDLVSGLEIIHPYGQVGCLPGPNRPDAIEYGNVNADYRRLSGGIRTFSEGLDNNQVMSQIGDMMLKAESIIFLGFGFHRQNIDLIRPSMPNSHNISGTVKDFSINEQLRIRAQLNGFMRSNSAAMSALEDLTCCNFFDDCWGLITGS